MTKQFEDQGGVAAMDPTPILRWITSKVMKAHGIRTDWEVPLVEMLDHLAKYSATDLKSENGPSE